LLLNWETVFATNYDVLAEISFPVKHDMFVMFFSVFDHRTATPLTAFLMPITSRVKFCGDDNWLSVCLSCSLRFIIRSHILIRRQVRSGFLIHHSPSQTINSIIAHTVATLTRSRRKTPPAQRIWTDADIDGGPKINRIINISHWNVSIKRIFCPKNLNVNVHNILHIPILYSVIWS